MPLPILGGIAAVRSLPWKLIGFCALGMAMVLMFAALRMSQAQNVKLKSQLAACAEEQRRLADESAAKQKETKRRVDKAKERIVIVERKAKEIEAAPLPGDCKTPKAILEADL